MSARPTVPIARALREALRRRAAVQGKTIADVVREILRAALEERPMGIRVGHLRGRLELPATDEDAWHQRLRQRNWRD